MNEFHCLLDSKMIRIDLVLIQFRLYITLQRLYVIKYLHYLSRYIWARWYVPVYRNSNILEYWDRTTEDQLYLFGFSVLDLRHMQLEWTYFDFSKDHFDSNENLLVDNWINCSRHFAFQSNSRKDQIVSKILRKLYHKQIVLISHS